MVGTNFCMARLLDARLALADLHRANFDRADLTGADLSGANLERTLLVETIVSGESSRSAGYMVPLSGTWNLAASETSPGCGLRQTISLDRLRSTTCRWRSLSTCCFIIRTSGMSSTLSAGKECY